MLKKIFNINSLIVLISILLGLLLCEGIIRYFYPEYEIWNYVIPAQDIDSKITGIPNSTFLQTNAAGEYAVDVHFNAYGFRDKKDIKNMTSSDIILAGDSYTFGYGVKEEDRFGNILQQLTFDNVSVYNIAFPGTDILNYKKNIAYASTLSSEAKKLIIGVCMENDLLTYEDIPEVGSKISKLKKWLHHNSSLYGFVGQKIHSLEWFENSLNRLGLMNDNSDLSALFTITEAALNQSVHQLEILSKEWNLLVVIIPSRLTWVGVHQEEANATHEAFKKKLEAKFIKILDLKARFEAAEKKSLKPFQFAIDGHWNERGHELVGKTIYDWLVEIDYLKVSINENQ